MMKKLILLLGFALITAPAGAQPAPTDLPGLSYDVEFFEGTSYDPAVPTPESLLGYRTGDQAAFPAEIERCLEAWAAASPRAALVEYARSHEDRALYYMILTSPENHSRLGGIKDGLKRLADPRGLSDAEADQLMAELPGTAWLAYSIHGDETSGSDAAMAVIYHLAAGQGEEVEGLLDDLVVLIDPMMNPDGRHRFLQQIVEHRGAHPNVDDQSLMHAGYWPWGRTNHYGFDLNRDWILGVNPETRGRIRAAAGWHPQLFVDAHEMGAQNSYLFSPARDPKNPNVPGNRKKWNGIFARDQSKAFDRYHWVYYAGEWNEGWYPGYSDSWGEYRGAVGILYEQAGFVEDGVRRLDGSIHTYREAVHHQAVSSIANLKTLQANVEGLRRDVLAERREAVSAQGPYSRRVFAILPTPNRSRQQRFLDLMELQGIEVYEAGEEFTASGIDQLGRSFRNRRVAAGSLLIPNRQPEAHLVATMLEFETRMTPEYLKREREEILKKGRGTIYDLTAWNLTMLYGLNALMLDAELPGNAKRYSSPTSNAPAGEPVGGSPVGWVIDGADDASVAAAARMMERGVGVRVARRAFELGGKSFARGSVVVVPNDNRTFEGDLEATVRSSAGELSLVAEALSTGLGDGDLPDIGGSHFVRLEPPRIALLSRGGLSVYDSGSIRFTLDHRLGIRHSDLAQESFDFSDLRRYNVIVLPDRRFGKLTETSIKELKIWMQAGGTLIAIGGSAAELTGKESELSKVRQLPDVLEELDAYEQQVLREWMAARVEAPDPETVWSHTAATELDYPWSHAAELERPDKEELERRDRWQRMFMPRGAILAARTDGEHWLTFGSEGSVPVLYSSSRVFMSAADVETPVRVGVFGDAPDAEAARAGWSVVPTGQELRLRMSGLLWPEATQRLANAALVTRERQGKGQIILFAVPATFRASTPATERLLMNALVYGPGFGTGQAIKP